jgi:hypothetical protein
MEDSPTGERVDIGPVSELIGRHLVAQLCTRRRKGLVAATSGARVLRDRHWIGQG